MEQQHAGFWPSDSAHPAPRRRTGRSVTHRKNSNKRERRSLKTTITRTRKSSGRVTAFRRWRRLRPPSMPCSYSGFAAMMSAYCSYDERPLRPPSMPCSYSGFAAMMSAYCSHDERPLRPPSMPCSRSMLARPSAACSTSTCNVPNIAAIMSAMPVY